MNGLKPSHKARAPLALAIGASLALGAASVPARAQVFGPVISLSTLDGGNGFRIDGVAAADFSGRAVSAAGDVNGDGIDDLIVGARSADPSGNPDSGSSYVVFGRAAGDTFAATLALSGLNGDNGFRIDGVAAGDRSGFAVSAAGDVNGDGIDDLIVGAYRADPFGGESGSSYVVFGRIGVAVSDLSTSVLDFGEVDVGLSSATQSVTLFSVGTARLDVTEIQMPDPGFDRVGGSCPQPPFRLVFNGECTLDYRFTPTAMGSVLATIDIVSASVTSPDEIVLFGTGMARPDAIFADGFEPPP